MDSFPETYNALVIAVPEREKSPCQAFADSQKYLKMISFKAAFRFGRIRIVCRGGDLSVFALQSRA